MKNPNKMMSLVRLLRPRQWVKNIFVLAPLVFSGNFLDMSSVESTFFAALLFCVASSAVYIVNDIHDMERDRLHATKAISRPLAAGDLSVRAALTLLFVAYLILFSAWFFVPKVIYIILMYLLLNYAYTFYLKDQPVLDIFTIAIGFVLRVYAGGVAISVPVSSWMFITTLCLALYLAAIKRRQELMIQDSNGRKVLNSYSPELIDRYAEMAGTGTLIFYSMFVMSSKPEFIITIPLVLFGLFRYWFVVEKKGAGESPTDTLLADVPLLLTVVLWVIFCIGSLLSK